MKYRNLALKMNLQKFTGTGLEFLKEVLGDQYDAFVNAVKTYNEKPENKDKQVKLGNIASGDYVSKEKYDRSVNDANTYNTQLQTAQTKLEEFNDVDVNDLKTQIQTLTNDLKTQKTNYENKIAERDFTDSLKAAITTAGGKNAKAIMALLDLDTLKASKNQENDIKSAIEACQKDNTYLFGANEPINNPTNKPPVGPTGGGDVAMTKEAFAKLGYRERVALKREQPEVYKTMIEE